MTIADAAWAFVGGALIYIALPEVSFWRRTALMAAIVALSVGLRSSTVA